MILIFNNLPLYLKLSETTRTKYYHKDDKNIPVRVENKIGSIYRWNHEGFLYDESIKKFVQKNRNTGPKTMPINGSSFWDLPTAGKSGANHAKALAAVKMKMKSFLTHWFMDELGKMEKPIIKEYPVSAEFIYNITKTPVEDVDNFKLFYEKALLDAIQTTKFIGIGQKAPNPVGFMPNDDKKHVRSVYHEINEGHKSNKLIIRFKPYMSKLIEFNPNEIVRLK